MAVATMLCHGNAERTEATDWPITMQHIGHFGCSSWVMQLLQHVYVPTSWQNHGLPIRVIVGIQAHYTMHGPASLQETQDIRAPSASSQTGPELIQSSPQSGLQSLLSGCRCPMCPLSSRSCGRAGRRHHHFFTFPVWQHMRSLIVA